MPEGGGSRLQQSAHDAREDMGKACLIYAVERRAEGLISAAGDRHGRAGPGCQRPDGDAQFLHTC